jgi:hypothetical protein
MGIQDNDKKQKQIKIYNIKNNIQLTTLCEGLPNEFLLFL